MAALFPSKMQKTAKRLKFWLHLRRVYAILHSAIHSQAWWNGRHAGLRSQCSRVRVQVPPPAPRKGSSLLATPFSYCRGCFEVLVPPSFAIGKTTGFDRTTQPFLAHKLPSVITRVQVPPLGNHFLVFDFSKYTFIHRKCIFSQAITRPKRSFPDNFLIYKGEISKTCILFRNFIHFLLTICTLACILGSVLIALMAIHNFERMNIL